MESVKLDEPESKQARNVRWLIWILWPSFIVAGAAEALFFTIFDPSELHVFGEPIELSRTAMYSIGFFLFWGFAAASSALTCFFQRSSSQINRGPMPSDQHTAGPPERDSGC